MRKRVYIFAGIILAFFAIIPTFIKAYGNNACNNNCVDLSSRDRFQKSLEWSLWTFRSEAWNGYIDFQGGGRYWTHWGYGKWSVVEAGKVHLVNEYDQFQHDFTIDASGVYYKGYRNDGLEVKGDLICGKYIPDLQISGSFAEQEIVRFYKEILKRDPDPEGFRFWLKMYNNGMSLEEIKQGLYDSKEYRDMKK